MASFPDDIYLGAFTGPQGLAALFGSALDNPTAQIGVGPMARVFYYNILPLAVQTASIAALQTTTASTGLTLAAGTGVTAVAAPDGSGSTVYKFDVPRCVSLTSPGSNLSGFNFTVTGFDVYGRRMTQTRAGPTSNTVNTLKAFASVLSVVPASTNAGTVSVGSSSIFGLPFVFTDIVYLASVKWAATLAQDGGTPVVADTTSPATAATGDTRGTYLPSSAADGARRLIIGMHLSAAQCGANPTLTAALGVTPA